MLLWWLALGCADKPVETGCLPSTCGEASPAPTGTTDSADPTDTEPDTLPPTGFGSDGCGLAPADALGGVQLTIDAGAAGDGVRGYTLVLPADYDPKVPHAVIVGYPGTDWTGEMIRPYLDLEDGARSDEIYVYLDPLWREFDGWGTFGGWVLGPHAAPADGMGDLVFTEAVLDRLESTYCVDTDRIFTTGHSWGGDMAAVTACMLGDRVTASVPVAANRPYWFEDGSDWATCAGPAAVWTMFGQADDHFTWQDYPGQFGDEQVEFWQDAAGCDAAAAPTALDYGAPGECVSYAGCTIETRYCLYAPDTGHQVPAYYSEATMDFFRAF